MSRDVPPVVPVGLTCELLCPVVCGGFGITGAASLTWPPFGGVETPSRCAGIAGAELWIIAGAMAGVRGDAFGIGCAAVAPVPWLYGDPSFPITSARSAGLPRTSSGL
jgi:hypothetical protein